jgi:rhamnosyltransferase
MTDRNRPLVAVLMATLNGEPWLREQIDSVLAQADVRVCVHASDDESSDATPDILRAYEDGATLHCLPPLGRRMGNANRNFLRLVRDAQIGDAEFVAFADQDDIWHPGKLRRAIDELTRTRAHAYSGNVLAFWENGRTRLLVKSQPQRRYDYLFESAGPGCTFVLQRTAFDALRAWIVADFARLSEAPVHDWLIYAYARTHHWRWLIDPVACMNYRQHERNEAGANVGRDAARRRLAQLRDGRFRRKVLAVAEYVDEPGWVPRALRRMNVLDRIRLAFAFRSLRRRTFDALVMLVFVAITK